MPKKLQKSGTQKRGLVKTKSYAEVLELGKSPRNKRALIFNYNRLAETINRQFRRHNKAFPDGNDFTRLFLATVKGRSIRPIKEKTKLTTKDIVEKSQLLYRLYNHPKYSIKAIKSDNDNFNRLYDEMTKKDWAKDILVPDIIRGKKENLSDYADRINEEYDRRKGNFKVFVDKGYLDLLNKFLDYKITMSIFNNANVTNKSFAMFMQDMNLYVKGKVTLDVAISQWRDYESELEKKYTEYEENTKSILKAREEYFLDVMDQYGDFEKNDSESFNHLLKGSESVEDLINAADAEQYDDVADIFRAIAEVKKRVQDYYKRHTEGKNTKRK